MLDQLADTRRDGWTDLSEECTDHFASSVVVERSKMKSWLQFLQYSPLSNFSQERCCWNLCHVKTGMWLAAIIELFIFALGIVLGFVDVSEEEEFNQ